MLLVTVCHDVERRLFEFISFLSSLPEPRTQNPELRTQASGLRTVCYFATFPCDGPLPQNDLLTMYYAPGDAIVPFQ